LFSGLAGFAGKKNGDGSDRRRQTAAVLDGFEKIPNFSFFAIPAKAKIPQYQLVLNSV